MQNREQRFLIYGLIAGVVLGFLIGFGFGKSTPEHGQSAKILNSQEVAEKTVSFLNEVFLNPKNLQGKVRNTSRYGELYQIYVDIIRNGEVADTQPVWVTRDGEIVIFDLMNMSEKPAIPEPKRVSVSEDDDPYIGSENAPVVIIEFSDYQCPFCQRFYKQTEKRLLEEYRGKIKLVYRDFPLEQIHPLALNASVAANCAGEQGKYWELHDLLFENVQEWSKTGNFTKYAMELGLDVDKFEACLSNKSMVDEVRKDLQDGLKAGVTGTPTFFINGIPVTGAQPYEVFKQIIDQELAGEQK